MIKSLFKILYIFILFLLSIINCFSQKKENYTSLSYEEIEKRIDDPNTSQNEDSYLINLYINKSKSEKNNESLFYAYRYASKFYNPPTSFKFADSALIIGIKSKNKKLLTDAYLNKGVVLMDNSRYDEALDNILIANKYSIELNNDYIFNKTIYYIAQNKIYLGLYEDANKELEICIKFFRNNVKNKDLGKDYEIYYIYSLMSLIDSNIKIGKFEFNKSLFYEAYRYLNINKLNVYKPYFVSSEGTEAFYNANYNLAIKKLSEAIRLYNDQWPHLNDIFYIGLSNWKLGKRDVAVRYFEEIDKEYEKSKKLNPEFRPAYELLIKYNDSIGNRDKQLKYINTLMSLDKNYEKNYKYLFSKINKEYDTHKLINEKNKIESSLKNQRTIISSILLITILASLFYWNRYNSLQKKYKEKFEEIISQKPILEKKEKLAEEKDRRKARLKNA